jgi:predicted transcriptional regulator
MTKLFRRGVEAVEALPAEQQDLAGALLLEIAKASEPAYGLTPQQVEDAKLAIAEADRGEFATDEEMEEVWKRFER